MKNKARVIAFYLPQYHPFKENDEWWGKGFTEWTNVGKAEKLFKNHYQPRVPADLGYYDLRMPVIREMQAEMARNAGVEGFMYWHYWFGNGRTLMENIFNEVLETGKPDFPFCLGWANHTWNRRTWNSAAALVKDEILIKQEYPGDEDIINHFYAVLPAFKDKRYITVDGKPLFLIYDPFGIPDIKGFLNKWNTLAKENGLMGIHFVAIASGREEKFKDILNFGFDALSISNKWEAETKLDHGHYMKVLKKKIKDIFPKYAPLEIYPYEKIIKYLFSSWDKKENCYPQIIPNWDRSPRGGRKAVIYTGSTPELFKQHMLDALKLIENKEDEHKIIFLRSWNEWAEGNYVEPDLKFGHGYLNVLKELLVEK